MAHPERPSARTCRDVQLCNPYVCYSRSHKRPPKPKHTARVRNVLAHCQLLPCANCCKRVATASEYWAPHPAMRRTRLQPSTRAVSPCRHPTPPHNTLPSRKNPKPRGRHYVERCPHCLRGLLSGLPASHSPGHHYRCLLHTRTPSRKP